MYEYFLPRPLRNFIDSIFGPPIEFLQMARDYLNHAGTIAGHGINLNNYFSFFGYLPPSMRSVVNALLAAVILIGIMEIVKVIIRMYYAFKDGAKWW